MLKVTVSLFSRASRLPEISAVTPPATFSAGVNVKVNIGQPGPRQGPLHIAGSEVISGRRPARRSQCSDPGRADTQGSDGADPGSSTARRDIPTESSIPSLIHSLEFVE